MGKSMALSIYVKIHKSTVILFTQLHLIFLVPPFMYTKITQVVKDILNMFTNEKFVLLNIYSHILKIFTEQTITKYFADIVFIIPITNMRINKIWYFLILKRQLRKTRSLLVILFVLPTILIMWLIIMLTRICF